jgi:hypothetical protein
MRQKYGVFAEESGEVRLIHEGSVRFSRANRFALKVFGQGVFFAHYNEFNTPVGERHKPRHIEKTDWKAVPSRATDVERDAEYMNAKPAKKFKKSTRKPKQVELAMEELSNV